MHAGKVAVRGAYHMLHMEVGGTSAACRHNTGRGGSSTSVRACRRVLATRGRYRSRNVTPVSEDTYRMFITVPPLSVVDLVQDVRVASSVADDSTYWLSGNVVVVEPFHVYYPAATSRLSAEYALDQVA